MDAIKCLSSIQMEFSSHFLTLFLNDNHFDFFCQISKNFFLETLNEKKVDRFFFIACILIKKTLFLKLIKKSKSFSQKHTFIHPPTHTHTPTIIFIHLVIRHFFVIKNSFPFFCLFTF